MSDNLEIADFQALTESIGENCGSEKGPEKKLTETTDAEDVSADVVKADTADELADGTDENIENNVDEHQDSADTGSNVEESNPDATVADTGCDDPTTNDTPQIAEPDSAEAKESDGNESEDDLLDSIVEVDSAAPAADNGELQDSENVVTDNVQSDQQSEDIDKSGNIEKSEDSGNVVTDNLQSEEQVEDTGQSEDIEKSEVVEQPEDTEQPDDTEQSDDIVESVDAQQSEDADLLDSIQESEDTQQSEDAQDCDNVQESDDVQMEQQNETLTNEDETQDSELQEEAGPSETDDQDFTDDIVPSGDPELVEENLNEKENEIDDILESDIIDTENTEDSNLQSEDKDDNLSQGMDPSDDDLLKQDESDQNDALLQDNDNIENNEDDLLNQDDDIGGDDSNDIQEINDAQMEVDDGDDNQTDLTDATENVKEAEADIDEMDIMETTEAEPEQTEDVVEAEQALEADAEPEQTDSAIETEKTLEVDARPEQTEDVVETEKALEVDAEPEQTEDFVETGKALEEDAEPEQTESAIEAEKPLEADAEPELTESAIEAEKPLGADDEPKSVDKEDISDDDILDSAIMEQPAESAKTETVVEDKSGDEMDALMEDIIEEKQESDDTPVNQTDDTEAMETDVSNEATSDNTTGPVPDKVAVEEKQVVTEAGDAPQNTENMEADTDGKSEEFAGYTEMETEDKTDADKKTEDKLTTTEAKTEEKADNKQTEEKKTTAEDIKQEDTENSKDSEPENSMGLKIVGVTSAVGLEEKPDKAKDEEDGCSDLNLKISSVSGSTDIEGKTVVKQETETPVVEEKKSKTVGSKKADPAPKGGKAEDDDVIAIKEEKKPAPKPKPSKIQTCIVCKKVGKCKYNIVRNGDVKHLCDDLCFKKFRSSPTTYLKQAESSSKDQDKTAAAANNVANQKTPTTTPASAAQPATPKSSQGGTSQVLKTCNVCQLLNVRTSKPFLNWMGLDFCGEECLGKFQGSLSLTCSYCQSHIPSANKAKYCWRGGNEVKHFCSVTCNNEFVKRLKLCAFCNKDLSQVGDSFMAPVGDKGTFRDFCSQTCLQQFEVKNKDIKFNRLENGKASQPPKGNFICAVCGKTGPVKHELKHNGKINRLCGDPCYSAFQYANKLTTNPCSNCGHNVPNDSPTAQYVQFEGQQKRFCSFICVNTFRSSNRKIVPCGWCGMKKNNFDMIERVDANNKYQLFCSLNCLSLYRVNLQATSNQAVVCDQCRKCVPAQYHLTMSDASVRNFCSYGCVMQFQAQFQTPKSSAPQSVTNNSHQATKQALSTPPQQVTTTRSGRVVKAGKFGNTTQPQLPPVQKDNNTAKAKAKSTSDSFPIISNVVSLAPQGNQQQINIKSPSGVTVTNQQQGVKTTTTTTSNTGSQAVQQQIIIQPPSPKMVKNKSLLCKPITQTKATSCRPHTQTKETQTDGKIEPDKYLVPVPVPVYCPTPLAMYSMPTPICIPIPVPIPVPVFIPTTKKSAASILKQIKEIQEKIPADPLEAELLMMAEAVAGKEEDSSSDSGEEAETEGPEAPPPAKELSNAPPQGDLGEDMLQMALRMASEMSDEPVMDLETSLEPVAVSTVPPQPAQADKSAEDDDDDYNPGRQTRRGRGTGANKRQSRSTPRRTAKRQKTTEQPQDLSEPATSPTTPVAPPLDANFHLKYTYGVNAYKHWVMQKNTIIEKQAKPGAKNLKTFKLDVLQCTPEELNHSLCLFVKEVRKPNGEMYAVDSIYYLCLGIQQYLFENGRIDNIFTDFYYERFNDCLNEQLTRYEPKLNHAGQLVCRIEEEHLWESKQLGAHSPYVLLNSLVYFNTKFFMLKTSEDHLKLSFTHIMKHWKKNPLGRGSGTGVNAGRSVYLRYYCPTPQGKADPNQKKKKEEMPVYEQTENFDNPLRCPVKLYEFYLSKCPESIKNRNDTFYLVPERSCVPDSPVWYSTAMLGIDQMAKMLNRIRLVREIQEAHLHTQPVYI